MCVKIVAGGRLLSLPILMGKALEVHICIYLNIFSSKSLINIKLGTLPLMKREITDR